MVALVLDEKPAQNIQSTSFHYDATFNTEVRKGRFKPAVADRNFFKMFIIKCFSDTVSSMWIRLQDVVCEEMAYSADPVYYLT